MKGMICSALDENAASYSTCKKWFNSFEREILTFKINVSINQKERKTQKLAQILDENPCQTQMELEDTFGMTQQVVFYRLQKLGSIRKANSRQR